MPASLLFPRKPQNWIEEEDRLRDSGLYFRLWRKPRTALTTTRFRLLFLIHGFGEHSGRYEHLCHYLQDAVDGIACFDHYGHGQSPGNRGSCNSSEDWLAGAEQALNVTQLKLKRDGYEVETQVLGHSFGGLCAVLLNKRGVLNGTRGVTLSAPLLALANSPPAIKAAVGTFIESFLPQLSLTNEIDPHVVSHDESVVRHYAEDRLNHNKITPRGFKEMQAMMSEARDFRGAFASPMQLILPGADPLVDERVSFKWFHLLDPQTKSERVLDMFPGFFHESFNEVDKELPLYALEKQLLARWSR